MSLEMIEDRVAIVPVEATETTEGGIVLTKTEAEKKVQGVGVVEFVGPGKILTDGEVKPMTVKPGDKVFYGNYAQFDFEHNGVKYAIISEDEILCKIT